MKRILDREEVKAIIDRRAHHAAIPTMQLCWRGEGLIEKYGDRLLALEKEYPEDLITFYYQEPGYGVSPTKNPEYRYGYKDYSRVAAHGAGQTQDLIDWSELDEFLEKFPDPHEPHVFDGIPEAVKKQKDTGRYCVGMWWRLFHEKFWALRGMENLMLDYYDNMDCLKIMGQKFLEYYKVIVERYAECGVDAIFSSDDLGHQRGPMMSPEIFETLYFPLYKELIEHIHKCGMHFILHSCGDNSLLMPYLAEAKLDVFHPVQAGCMDMQETAEKYGEKMSFLVGVDVQHLLPEGSLEEVRAGLEKMVQIFYKEKGGMLVAAGNGIMPDTPFENIEFMLKMLNSYR